MNQIRIECGKKGWVALRTNVGKFPIDGGWFDTGLPKGFPDLLVLTNTGEAIFVFCHPQNLCYARTLVSLSTLNKCLVFQMNIKNPDSFQ